MDFSKFSVAIVSPSNTRNFQGLLSSIFLDRTSFFHTFSKEGFIRYPLGSSALLGSTLGVSEKQQENVNCLVLW